VCQKTWRRVVVTKLHACVLLSPSSVLSNSILGELFRSSISGGGVQLSLTVRQCLAGSLVPTIRTKYKRVQSRVAPVSDRSVHVVCPFLAQLGPASSIRCFACPLLNSRSGTLRSVGPNACWCVIFRSVLVCSRLKFTGLLAFWSGAC
jgi:hypothetical protein